MANNKPKITSFVVQNEPSGYVPNSFRLDGMTLEEVIRADKASIKSGYNFDNVSISDIDVDKMKKLIK